jgi:hypothetical protein
MPPTDEDREATIASIVREREAYKRAGDTANVEHCEAELRRLAPERQTPRQKAETRGQS